MSQKSCVIYGCESKDFAELHYCYKQFCKLHYAKAFREDLNTVFTEWDGLNEPPDRLKYLIGRYYDENETKPRKKPTLTQNIVRNRSYGWKKTGDSAIFTVIRYPVHRKYGRDPVGIETHMTWHFDCSALAFSFISKKRKKRKITLI